MEAGENQAEGPIFLEGLFCEDGDESIQDCQRRRPQILGLTSCTHLGDVWIKCNGQ